MTLGKRLNSVVLLVLGVLALSGCASMFRPSTPEGKLPFPRETREESTRSSKELRAVIEKLHPIIGTYPSKFSSEAQQVEVYDLWADAFLDAQANLQSTSESESGLWLLAELARQGHNMDVHDAWKVAEETIEKCLAKFPKSVICNFSAVDYFISIKVSSFSTANLGRSLSFLRKHFAPKVNENVEEKFILYHLYRDEPELALAQIDRFLELFPRASARNKALKLKSELLAKSS